ncbi:MAG: hypothetical protein IJN20_08865 [Oscillospiraceae bacterium]|nr:hypothetical protein [Oscillospiraceae bacterium]
MENPSLSLCPLYAKLAINIVPKMLYKIMPDKRKVKSVRIQGKKDYTDIGKSDTIMWSEKTRKFSKIPKGDNYHETDSRQGLR